MVEKVISFETAKLARDKGFDLVTDGYYDEIGHPTYLQWNKYANHPSFSPLCTQALLQKWLREVHCLDVSISSCKSKDDLVMWSVMIYNLKRYDTGYNSFHYIDVRTYKDNLPQTFIDKFKKEHNLRNNLPVIDVNKIRKSNEGI